MSDKIKGTTNRHERKGASFGLFWGMLGLGIALLFLLLEEGIEMAIHHSPFGGLLLFCFFCLFLGSSPWPGLQEYGADARQGSLAPWPASPRMPLRGSFYGG